MQYNVRVNYVFNKQDPRAFLVDIGEYVRCMMCHTPETILERDQIMHANFLRCNICGSNQSVAPIKTLFQATSKADRRQVKKTAAKAGFANVNEKRAWVLLVENIT
eukprot:373785_1